MIEIVPEVIEIVPEVLEYKPPFSTSSTEHVTIKNKSKEKVAFKVKTTAPKIYCVRPNAAVVAPGEEVQIQVILLGLSEEPAPDFKCKDKFLLITLPAPYDLGETTVAEAWPQLEAEFKDQAMSKRIRVKYLMSHASKNEGEKSPADAAGAASAAPATEAIGATSASAGRGHDLKEGVDTAQEKVVDNAPRVANPVNRPASQTTAIKHKERASLSNNQEPVSAFNPALVLALALLALALGWLYY
ncbi:HDL276Wp [Eremothecium sinecaudum]|uniref:HDL276Wp n=1 Tax=Eremothecium sinecaudum TaxID=45286 RepID=A0A0X8HS97_9SACH|nr:HDL276Wp [Eremothecium sinecaudum]AMD20468.1 HDL276Wp [Eremothecium sinecaudum]